MATFDQTEILWNKYKNLPTAFPTQTFLANQAVGDAFPTIIPTTQIWSSEIPATAPTALGSAVSITNGSYQQSTAYSWIRKYTITMGVIQAPVESYWYASTDPNDPLGTNEARDTIPFNFDPLGSYTIQVFANGTPVSPTFLDYPWNYDDAAGILTFYPINPLVLPPAPITMVYWRYVGNKGGSALSYWNITDPPPGTNLNFDYLGTTKAIINSSGDFDAHTITAFSFIGDGAGLTGGPASAFTSGTTAKINTIANTTSVILYPTMVIIPTTNPAQIPYTNSNFSYSPTTSKLSIPNLSLSGTFADTTADVGTAGQVLSSTGTGTNWITQGAINDGTLTITNGTFMTGSGTFTANQSGNTSITIGTNATNLNTASTIVARDATGNFSAGTITADLVGTASSASTLTTNLYSGSIAMYPTFSQYGFTNQTIYVDGLSNFKYQPDIATLSTEFIVATNLPVVWNSDYLLYGYVPTFPSPAVTGRYFLLTQLDTTGASGNDGAQTFRGCLSSWSGGSAQVEITFRSRTSLTAEGSISSSNISVASLVAVMDIEIYNNAGIFTTYLHIKPSMYYFFDFTISGLSRDTINIIFPVSLPTTATPAGTLQIASVLTALEVTNISGALTATSVTATTFTGSLTGSATLIDTTLFIGISATHYVTFVPVASASPNGQVLTTDNGLTYNPSTNDFAVVNGSITGTNSTISGTTITASTQFTGPATGLTGTGASFTAGSADLAKVVSSAAATPFPLVFATASTTASLLNEISLTYQPSNNALVLTGGTFTCPTITGTDVYATTFSGSGAGLTGTGVSFTAGFSTTSVVSTTSFSYDYGVIFALYSLTGSILYNSTGLTFNPSSNTLKVDSVEAIDIVCDNINRTYYGTFLNIKNRKETNCFLGSIPYKFYDITITFTSPPDQFSTLSIDFANSAGTLLGSGWGGRMSVLATTYQTVIWGSTVGTISACTNVANASYTFTIENAYSAKPKIINATNNGDYSTGTLYINSPIISSGRNTSAVAYPTLYWVVSSVVASVTGNITVIGRN